MNRSTSSSNNSKRATSRIVAIAVATCAACYAGNAQAQSIIRQPGNHPPYSVDLEPHFLFSWDDSYWGGGGLGLGMRATIPFLRNGPVSNINNDMGIGFGLDWATHGGCGGGIWGPNFNGNYYYYDCSGYSIYLPVVLQWNFYLTDIITVYGEPGFAFRYAHWSYTWNGPNNPQYYSNGYVDPLPVFGGGAKFMFGKSIGLNVRASYPYFSVGVSFLL
jgi:hypothetical protein